MASVRCNYKAISNTSCRVIFTISQLPTNLTSLTLWWKSGANGTAHSQTCTTGIASITVTGNYTVSYNSDIYCTLGASDAKGTVDLGITSQIVGTTPSYPGGKWSWSSGIAQNQPVSNLTATAWNNFCDRINSFRAFAGYSQRSFTRAVSKTTKMTAEIFNEAISAIVSAGGTGITTVVAKGRITADLLQNMATACNEIAYE